jgi:hypothetical protein
VEPYRRLSFGGFSVRLAELEWACSPDTLASSAITAALGCWTVTHRKRTADPISASCERSR